MNRSALILSSAFCLPALAGGHVARADAQVAMCETSAWSTDKDPNGLNVRAGPGTDNPVIGRLPPPLVLDGDTFAAEVSITGSQDGWLRIDEGWLTDYSSDEETGPAFKGVGWVSGALLRVWVEGVYLRSAPSRDAVVTGDFSETRDGDYGPDYFVVERLHGCQGFWMEVEGTYFGKRFRGWTDDTCASQVTTCP